MFQILNTLFITLVFLLFSIVPVVGIIFIYAAITGKFLVAPHKNQPRFNHFIYRIRGIIGIGFLIFGFWMLWGFYQYEF